MNVITKDGKDYLITSILKLDKNHIVCEKFFDDIQNAKNEILLKNNKTLDDEIGYGEYGSNLNGILKRFKGDYFSPSFMKNFMTNPANTIFNAVAKEDVNDATAIGTTLHKVLEIYYNQDKSERNRKDIIKIGEENKVEGQNQTDLNRYFNGYIDTKDYLDDTKELDDTTLECFCEVKGRDLIYIPKFNLSLPLELSYVVDRIDLRDDKLYIIDYKTGYQTDKSATFDGYLGSMILYKWAVEQEFGLPVAGGYLSTPGNDKKYIPLDFSLVNESRMVSQVFEFNKLFESSCKTRIYNFTDKGYFTSEDMKKFRIFMNDDDTIEKEIEIEIYLGENTD